MFARCDGRFPGLMAITGQIRWQCPPRACPGSDIGPWQQRDGVRREVQRACVAPACHRPAQRALTSLAAFSSESIARKKSYQNEELNLAVEQMRLRAPGISWLIPVRFDDCVIPDWDIGAGRSLVSIHRADLFGVNLDGQLLRLVAAVRRALHV
jgi:hypothetical protein